MILLFRVQLNNQLLLNILGDVGTLGLVEILTRHAVSIPLQPGVLGVVEASKRCLDYLERLAALANADNLTGLNTVGSNAYYLTVDNNVAVVNQLTCCSTSGGNAKTINDVVEAALEVLKQNLTGDATGAGSLFKHITELFLEYTISVAGLLLLGKHYAVLRSLAAAVITVLTRRIVTLSENFVSTKDGLAKTAGNS